MADALQTFGPIFVAGKGAQTIAALPIDLGLCDVSRILITWPAGCGGLVGIQIQAAGGFAFPSKPNQFLSFDDYTYDLEVNNQTTSGKWSIVGYNVDYIDHLITVVFEYDYLRGNVVGRASQPIAI